MIVVDELGKFLEYEAQHYGLTFSCYKHLLSTLARAASVTCCSS